MTLILKIKSNSEIGEIIRSIIRIDVVLLDLPIDKMLLFIYANVYHPIIFYFLIIVLIRKLTHTFV